MARSVILGWLVSLLLVGSTSFGLSIKEIPALVSTHNHEVLSSEKDIQAAGHAIWAARSRYYPQLNLHNTFIHLGDDIRLQFPAQGITGSLGTISFLPPPITLQKRDVFLSSIQLKMPLFTGGRITAGVSAAQAKRDEARAEHSKVTDEKTREALTRYFGVKLARNVTETLKNMGSDLRRIRGIAESLLKSGLGTKFSVMQIKVAEADLASRTAEAAGKAEVADLAFKVSIGKPQLDEVVYETPMKKAPLPPKPDLFKVAALQQRAEFKVLKAKGEQVDALRSATFGKMLPALYAVGSYQLTTTNLPLLTPNWVVGVVLDVPITAALETIPERQEALRLSEKVEIQSDRAKQEIPLLVDKLYAELRASDVSYRAMEEAVELSREGLRLAEVRFKSGNGSVLEVLRASTDWETAQIKLAQITEEFNRKLLELYGAAGDVRPFVDLYVGNVK
jgi:outer membrane protein TolC